MSQYVKTLSGRHQILVWTTVVLSMLIPPACSQEMSLEELKQKAEQGDADAQFNLGTMYENGQGVPQDYAEAVRWYRMAADQGDAYAQYKLGVMYADGRGVPQDDAEAVRWYRAAAEQGSAEAQTNLGVMYDQGRGVARDYIQAHKWYSLAAAKAIP